MCILKYNRSIEIVAVRFNFYFELNSTNDIPYSGIDIIPVCIILPFYGEIKTKILSGFLAQHTTLLHFTTVNKCCHQKKKIPPPTR